jgi:hypothetical protein
LCAADERFRVIALDDGEGEREREGEVEGMGEGDRAPDESAI